MLKQTLISSATSALIAIAIVLVMGGSANFAGQTRISGLSIGASGLTVTSGGAVDLGSGDVSIGTSGTVSSVVIGGATLSSVKESLTTATTTVCAIQSPAATSTLIYGAVNFTTSSTTASTVTLAKSATAFATTTSLGASAIAANAQGIIVASSTPTAGQTTVFGPSEWFVVGMQGGVGTFSPVGSCVATWQQI
jgi:hypothetical protein